jgi:hypothetical protein
MTFAPGARGRLTSYDLARFAGSTLFDRIGRVVCGVGRVSRKELYETWEVARRVRRWCRGGRVMDVAGGHGLLAHLMLLLDDSSPEAVVVDPATPPSSVTLQAAFAAEWPRLRERISYLAQDVGHVAFGAADVVVSSHACGSLTDRVLDVAIDASATVAVLPCCHEIATCDAGPLTGWVDGALAIDVVRAMRLVSHGYHVRTQTIPRAITPKNRLLIGVPSRVP